MVSDMAETFGIEGVPDRFVDAFMTARHWWGEDDSRLLPGEEGGSTVFVVDFTDGCRYCGYTGDGVAGRVASLISDVGGWGANAFVREQAGGGPYLVRCVASNLDEWQARKLRDLMVTEAPGEWAFSSGTTLESAGCWLSVNIAEKEVCLVQSK